MADSRTITAREPWAVPWLSVVLGFGPMLPFVGGAALAWWSTGEIREVLVMLTTLWGAANLVFLSGVRRGVSFRTKGGPRPAQIAKMFGLFSLGFLALMAAAREEPSAALSLLIPGYAAIAILDPIAARRGEASLHFARLRSLQMPVAIIGLATLLATMLVLTHRGRPRMSGPTSLNLSFSEFCRGGCE